MDLHPADRTSGDPLTRVLIVDDEPVARAGLRGVVASRTDVALAGECRNGREAVLAIRGERPDLVLLDVQMPGLDGLAVLRAIGADAMPATIFVTAFDRFAVQAFEMAAVDYVVKPYSRERLDAAIDRALARLREHRVTAAHERLLAALADAASAGARSEPRGASDRATRGARFAERLIVSVGARGIIVPIADVVSFQADGYCVTVVTAGSRYVLRESLERLEARLDPAEFLRVHRSVIVRITAVRSIERAGAGRLVLAMADGSRIAVSRSRRDAVVHAVSGIEG